MIKEQRQYAQTYAQSLTTGPINEDSPAVHCATVQVISGAYRELG